MGGMTSKECRDLAAYLKGKVEILKKRVDYPVIKEQVARLQLTAENLAKGADEREKREQNPTATAW